MATATALRLTVTAAKYRVVSTFVSYLVHTPSRFHSHKPGTTTHPLPGTSFAGNHSSTTIVNGQSFSDWFKDTYIFDDQGTSPLVSGFYFDDYIPPSGGFPDPYTNMTEDMGLTPYLQKQLSDSYVANMARVYDEVLARGMFSWQQLWNVSFSFSSHESYRGSKLTNRE